jgi:subtilisin family serine protease
MPVGNTHLYPWSPGRKPRRSARSGRALAAAVAVLSGLTLAGPALADTAGPSAAPKAPSATGAPTRGPIRYADDVTPNDPLWANEASYLQAMRLPAAWATTTGNDNQILAILDSGVLSSHPDLAGRLDMRDAWNFVDNNNNVADDCGHGTMVAGIAAASTNTNPARGVAGATWRGRILPLKVMHLVNTPNGPECATEDDGEIAAAITYAANHGASVINMSLGGTDQTGPILQQAIDNAVAAGVVVVAAAGNDGSSAPHYPAASPGVVAVGSTNSAGVRSSWSNFGSWVDIVAPGENIAATMSSGGYGSGDGTSFASPLVAAVVMLMRAADPNSDEPTIVKRLLATERSVSGGGMVDAASAVAASENSFSIASTNGSGYWMLGQGGSVYRFGGASFMGNAAGLLAGGATATDLAPTPSGGGYWIVDSAGHVFGFGDAGYFGGASGSLGPGEQVTSISATPNGGGYWLFTNLGRVFNFGNAPRLGDLAGLALNGPIVGSVATPSGQGYYMVGSDGGIFAIGDAHFDGSMGGRTLNAPVQSLVPDPDGTGYWLVASDGGVFAFDAPFRGSMGGTNLNAPVTGMVPFGNGYLMVASDGGAFDFSDQPFSGSLVGITSAQPIVSIAAKAAAS